ncbi:MAG TPA: alkaline phosphatase D family protein [Thermoanaerobaculia bacterium]
MVKRLLVPLLSAVILLAAAPTPRPGPKAAIRSGPMLGYADLTEASVWIQTTADAGVRLRYWPEGTRAQSRVTPELAANDRSDHIALFVVPGLEPGSRYGYEILIGGSVASFPAGGTTGILSTQKFWQWRSDPPDFTVAFGSCFYANEPKMDRPGKPYGSDPSIFRTIAAAKPDLMLWLGDNIYYREPDFGSVAAMKRRWALGREEPALQPLLGVAHHYAIWDDHDFGPNDSIWINRYWKDSFDIFRSYWANPTWGARGVDGVFGSFSWGDVDFFLLDDRMYRTPERAPETGEKAMLGAEQLRWLRHSLSYSRAPFKIIVNGSQVLNSNARDECFAHYTREQKELIDWIVQQRIRGVVFLSGDRHESELLRETPEGSYTLYDFTSSPLTAGLTNPMPKEEENNPLRVPGTLVNDLHSFGLLKFTGSCNERKVELQVVDREGKRRWTHTIRGSDLLPPPAPGVTPGPYRGHSSCSSLNAAADH